MCSALQTTKHYLFSWTQEFQSLLPLHKAYRIIGEYLTAKFYIFYGKYQDRVPGTLSREIMRKQTNKDVTMEHVMDPDFFINVSMCMHVCVSVLIFYNGV